MSRRDESGFRHGLRVRVGGAAGPKGVLFECRGRNGPFWKVRLQGGEWVWPDDLIVDGPGTEVNPCCASCALPFIMRAGSGELICNRCDAEQFGTAVRATDPPTAHTFDHIPHHRHRS
jgi:hypothetical protein